MPSGYAEAVRSFVVAVASLALGAGCSASHSGADAGRSDAGPRVVPGVELPWEDVSIRFVGLTDLGEPNGNDMAVDWEIRHGTGPDQDLGLELVVSTYFGDFDDVSSLTVNREPGLVRARVRIQPMGPPLWVSSVLSGLRLERRVGSERQSWLTATHDAWFRIPDDGVPLGPRPNSLDGRVTVELLVAPDLEAASVFWYPEADADYEVVYRVHNHTDRPHRVRLRNWYLDLDASMEIPAHGSIDVPLTVRFSRAEDPYPFGLKVRIEGEERDVDEVYNLVDVRP